MPPPTTISALYREMIREFEYTNESVAEIKGLAETTNGRVQTIELRQAFIRGALAVLSVLMLGGAGWLAVLTH